MCIGLRQAEEEELRILRAAEECAPPAPVEEVGAPCFSGDITLTARRPAVTLSPEQARTLAPQGKLLSMGACTDIWEQVAPAQSDICYCPASEM